MCFGTFSFLGLAAPGVEGSWQTESKVRFLKDNLTGSHLYFSTMLVYKFELLFTGKWKLKLMLKESQWVWTGLSVLGSSRCQRVFRNKKCSGRNL